MQSNPTFLITIDVEDWFQVENFKAYIPRTAWDSHELRVERNTHKLLDLFDEVGARNVEPGAWSQERGTESQESSAKSQYPNKLNNSNPLRATFFILGWVAQRLPGLVREIKRRGHEVASHGFGHEMCNQLSPSALKADLVKSRKLLEDITGTKVHGYRAPSFSVDNDILKIIEEAGYEYDASYNSFDKHGRYGKLMTNGFKKTGIAYDISGNFYELPLSNLSFSKIRSSGHPSSIFHLPSVFPWAGGGYFRLIPDVVFNWGAQAILSKDSAYHFYMHPWEIDPSQPRVNQAPVLLKFRHYVNLDKTENKLRNVIRRFGHCRFSTCSEYLDYLKEQNFATDPHKCTQTDT